jgi:ABC-type lipoprotein release transport system permease subunit
MGSRLIAGLLFDVRPMDMITYSSVTVTLLCVALVACWVPARRAGRVNPMEILRAE